MARRPTRYACSSSDTSPLARRQRAARASSALSPPHACLQHPKPNAKVFGFVLTMPKRHDPKALAVNATYAVYEGVMRRPSAGALVAHVTLPLVY